MLLLLAKSKNKLETLFVCEFRFADMSFKDGFGKEDMWFKLAKWQKLANEFELLRAPLKGQ